MKGSSRELVDLYGDPATYLAQLEQAALAAEKAGVILRRDVDALLEEARATRF